MGQSEGTLRSHRVIHKHGQIVLDAHTPPEILEFSPEHSYMVSYGIDLQTSPNYRHKTLTKIAGFDAEHIAAMFQKTVGLPSQNVQSFVASRKVEDCTFEGMRRTFLFAANKVDTNGIFIFHFTGHGLKVGKAGEYQWGLVPADFDRTKEKFITGEKITSWLHEVRFQGRYVLIILDSCYSGGMAEVIATGTVEHELPIGGLYVFTSCTANEASLVVTALGQSIFNYFFCSNLFKSYAQPGKLPIKEIYENCDACCMAFSSLLLSYDSTEDVLKWRMMQPEFKYYQLTAFVQSVFDSEEEQTDSAAPGRFSFVLEYYDFTRHTKKRQPIEDKCLSWLQTASCSEGALAELEKRELLNGPILSAAVASMMYSVASIFIACDQENVTDPNIFIIAFIHVLAAIDNIHRDLEISRNDLKLGLEYYVDVLRKHKIPPGRLSKLYTKIVEGEEGTDSGEYGAMPTEDVVIDIPELPMWQPGAVVEL